MFLFRTNLHPNFLTTGRHNSLHKTCSSSCLMQNHLPQASQPRFRIFTCLNLQISISSSFKSFILWYSSQLILMIFSPKKNVPNQDKPKANLCWSLFMPFYKDICLLTYLFYFCFTYLSSLINIFIVILLYFPPIVSIEENCSKFGEFGNG